MTKVVLPVESTCHGWLHYASWYAHIMCIASVSVKVTQNMQHGLISKFKEFELSHNTEEATKNMSCKR